MAESTTPCIVKVNNPTGKGYRLVRVLVDDYNTKLACQKAEDAGYDAISAWVEAYTDGAMPSCAIHVRAKNFIAELV